MTSRALIIGFACTTLAVFPLGAHADAQQIRFVTAGAAGNYRWQGRLERLTPDSLYLRVGDADTIAVFSRGAIRLVERERGVSAGRAVSIGCVTVGGVLGALGYFGTHDPDSPGLEKTAGAIGLVVGCGVGAVGGLVVAAVRSQGWELWTLPDSVPSVPSR